MDQRNEAIERLLAGYRRYYSITRFDGGKEEEVRGLREAAHIEKPFFSGHASLAAVCEHYEQAEKFSCFIPLLYGRPHRRNFYLFSMYLI